MVNLERVIHSQRLGCQHITVQRSSAGWVNGQFKTNGSPEELVIDAIVTIAGQKDLQQVPEGDRVTGSMKFLTADRLYQTSNNGISDIVLWRGAKYRIVTISPDVDYGFYRSVGVRMEGDGIG